MTALFLVLFSKMKYYSYQGVVRPTSCLRTFCQTAVARVATVNAIYYHCNTLHSTFYLKHTLTKDRLYDKSKHQNQLDAELIGCTNIECIVVMHSVFITVFHVTL